MVANINSIAYRFQTERDIPWHGLGTKVAPGADVEAYIQAAGLDWKVGLAKLFLHRKGQGVTNSVEVPTHRAIVRTDTGTVFGLATESYTPFQNRDLFESFPGFEPETVGALGDGERAWGLYRTGEDLFVAGEDRIAPYFLATAGHDGGTAVVLKLATTRVVCQNTLAVALGEHRGTTFRIRHTTSVKERVAIAATGLLEANKLVKDQVESFDKLAQAKFTEEALAEALAILAPDPAKDAKPEQVRNVQAERLAIWKLFNQSPTVDRGSLYGIFNTATEYLDWYDDRKGQNPTSTNKDWLARRAVSNLEGDAADQRQAVFASLIARV